MSFCIDFSKFATSSNTLITSCTICTKSMQTAEKMKKLTEALSSRSNLPPNISFHEISEIPTEVFKQLSSASLSPTETKQEQKLFGALFRLPHNDTLGMNRFAFSRLSEPDVEYKVAIVGDNKEPAEKLFPDPFFEECAKLPEQEGIQKLSAHFEEEDKKFLASGLQISTEVQCVASGASVCLKTTGKIMNYLKDNQPFFMLAAVDPFSIWRFARAPSLREVKIVGHINGFPLIQNFSKKTE